MADTTDLIGLAIDKNPIDFASTFNDLIRDKAMAALENKRVEMAQSIYGEPDQEPEVDTDTDDDDFDFDDADLDDVDDDDDLDLDLDDIDLDDLELDNEEDINDQDD